MVYAISFTGDGRIVAIPDYFGGGRPCIRGMRITVYDVFSYLAAGILDDFPYLTPEDIQASLAYAAERERHMLVTAS